MTKTAFTHESQSSVTVEWYTPKWIFDKLNTRFDLDVAAPQGGVEWVPCTKYIALPQDSLQSEWEGFTWCNPPYGKETQPFLAKMLAHNNGIALVFSRTDTQWFHKYAAKADCLFFIEGRVQFVDGQQNTNASGSTCGSVFIGYGEKAVGVLKNCQHKGLFVQLKEPT